jgi:hypothetical protein
LHPRHIASALRIDVRTLAEHYNDEVTLGWTEYLAKSAASTVAAKAMRRRILPSSVR